MSSMRGKKEVYLRAARALVGRSATLDQLRCLGFDINLPLFTVSTTGCVTGIHPQTLRQYDRLSFITPYRTTGGSRRYSLRDIHRIIEARRMSEEEGINIPGITRIFMLEEENRRLRFQLLRLQEEQAGVPSSVLFSCDSDGSVTRVRRNGKIKKWPLLSFIKRLQISSC